MLAAAAATVLGPAAVWATLGGIFFCFYPAPLWCSVLGLFSSGHDCLLNRKTEYN